MMRTDPNWLEKWIASVEKEREACQNTYNICKEADEKKLEPHLIWLQGKERAEKELKGHEKTLKMLKKLLSKKKD